MRTPSAVESAQEMTDTESYRRRSSNQVSDDASRRFAGESRCPEYADILSEIKEMSPEDLPANDWNTDPYKADPDTTAHYIDTYFTHINDSLFHIFPRRRFSLWLQSCQSKSLQDKMLLYSMMTLGCVFSDRPERATAMRMYSRTARYALERSQHDLSLQFAQSRIIMGLWYYAIGALVRSWDSIGAAVRTVCGLRYHLESGGIVVDRSQACEYGLHPQALMECRRRTFWVAFLMDVSALLQAKAVLIYQRFSNFYTQASTFIPSQSAFLRLPCQEEIFEAQQYATVPYFQSFTSHGQLSLDNDLSTVSPTAFWIEIVSRWGDVLHHSFRLPHVPAEVYSTTFDEFYSTTVQRLEEWNSKLPSGLTFTSTNLAQSIRARKADVFISIHLLYHATLMKLNRHARYQHFRPATVNEYIHRARHHAVEMLRVSAALGHYASEYEPLRSVAEPGGIKTTILNPFLGYLVVSAVDVLSALGLIADMPECINLIKSGLDLVKELSRFWDSSLHLVSLIEARLACLSGSVRYPARIDGNVAFAMDGVSLDRQVSASMVKDATPGLVDEDLLYGGLPRERLFSALGIEDPTLSEANILCIREG